VSDPTLELRGGDTVQIGGPSANLMKVVQRTRGGYIVLPNGAELTEMVTDRDLVAAYNAKTLRHWPCNLQNVEENRAKVLQTSFGSWPENYQREALRRLSFVEAVDLARDAHPDVLATCKAVVPGVYAERVDAWNEEERDAARDAQNGRRRRNPRQPGEEVQYKRVGEPKPSSVRTWHSDWVACGRDPLGLMPMWHLRGRRQPRFTVAADDDTTDTYKLMEEATKSAYLDLVKRSKQIAYEVYKELCLKAKLTQVVSGRTFRRFIQKRYDEYERYAARHGNKKAYLRFGIFSLRQLPDKPLQEVEVDHCLIDLIVVDENGKVLGRPWVTVLLDRATKCIVGVHVSFMPPGYATVQRAILHALYEKDLSGFPGLEHSWPCFGLVEWLISDRGKEFLSKSFREACLLLSIFPIALPGRRPWLKGAIERIFRTMHARVFDLQEGTTKANDAEVYNSVKRARVTRVELDRMIIEWIVDEYHQRPHPALKRKYKREMTPHQAWEQQIARFPVRFAPDPQLVYQLTCEIFERRISNTGIRIKNHLYVDEVLLGRLLRRPGARERDWTFRRDKLNLGRIWVWDEDEIVWHPIPNADPEISEGASEIMFAMWKGAARDTTPAGEAVDVEALRRGRAIVEEQRAASLKGVSKMKAAMKWVLYGEMGGPFTPVPALERPDDLPSTPPSEVRNVANDDHLGIVRDEGAAPTPTVAGTAVEPAARQSDGFAADIDAEIAKMMERMA